jgi:hypothetical protein
LSLMHLRSLNRLFHNRGHKKPPKSWMVSACWEEATLVNRR